MSTAAWEPTRSIREVAADWVMRLGGDELTLEDQLAFEAWLVADPAHRPAFEQMAAVWRNAPAVADAPELICVRAAALESFRLANRRRWSSRVADRWPQFAAMAACLLLVLIGGVHLLRDDWQHYTTGVGERRVVKLADGSRISLDAATQVDVAYSGERRSLRLLYGRAKFDVAKDPRRPFTVAARDRLVVATGTAFSVEIVQRQMRVVLYEGNVAVLEDGPSDRPPRHVELAAKRAAAADQALKPGNMMVAALDTPLARIEATDLPRSLSWEGGQLNFSDEPLAIAAERVNRYSDTKIVIDDQAAARLQISGAFNAGDTEGFIDGVTALYPISLRREGSSIRLGFRLDGRKNEKLISQF